MSGLTTVSYAENDTAEVATYAVSDPEEGAVTLSPLSGADAAKFSIDDGVLTFNDSPNFEAPGDANTDNIYLVTIVVSDETHTATKDVTITVTDVNEPPVFDEETPSALSIDENTGPGQDIGDPFAATDPDAGATLDLHFGGSRRRVL